MTYTQEQTMAMKVVWRKVWRKVEEILIWPFATMFLGYSLYAVLVLHQRVEGWSFLSIVLMLAIATYWWAGFKYRLAKFLRGALREMLVEELAESRIAFVTWLREGAPWRGENPFSFGRIEEDAVGKR